MHGDYKGLGDSAAWLSRASRIAHKVAAARSDDGDSKRALQTGLTEIVRRLPAAVAKGSAASVSPRCGAVWPAGRGGATGQRAPARVTFSQVSHSGH